MPKDVAEKTVRDAAIEIHNNKINTYNSATLVDTSVQWDGTCHRRDFWNSNCVSPAISLDDGKILDVE